MSRIRRLVVAVPVRNEEHLLVRCLEAIERARSRLEVDRVRTGAVEVPVDVVVALDRCTDGSAAVARRFPVRVLELDAGAVGAARRAAGAAGLLAAEGVGVPPRSTWICCTDADSVVPREWLVRHLELADSGVDLVVGTVEPDGDTDPGLMARWWRRHRLAEGHPHVHGANLGVRASAYLEVGGFLPVTVGEDVALVDRLRRAGHPGVSTDRTRVRTSGRLHPRAAQGFGSYLAELGGEASAVAAAERGPVVQNTGLPPVTPRTVPET